MVENILDIILVEDNPCDIEMTLDALKENNLANRVRIFRNGEEAVNYIFKQGEDCNVDICAHPHSNPP